MNHKTKLLFFVTEDWYFCSHRLPLALSAKANNFDVTVVTCVNNHGGKIKASGLNLIPIEMSRRGINPFQEIRIIKQLYSIYKHEQPDIVHHIALKPVLYGTIAAAFSKVPHVVNAMAGLGFLFSSNTLKARFVRPLIMLLFRLLLNRKNSRVILQNPDDLNFMYSRKILFQGRAELIQGSGVDINKFNISKEQAGKPIVILASRLLWDKGVGEFVDAAEILTKKNINARFVLIGDTDSENPSAITVNQLNSWDSKGVIEWWGYKSNMAEIFAQSHIVCLPSFYGEGVPKVLIEAAACGKPIVTTDTPGCREIVQNGMNGVLVPPRDSVAVAKALQPLIESFELRREMGNAGRKLVEEKFSLERVNRETLNLYARFYQ